MKRPAPKALALVIGLVLVAAGGRTSAQPTPPATDVRLPALFSDHMVMQRGQPLAVWGWANPGSTVRVSLDVHTAAATVDADGRWRAELPPMEAGGPFELVVAGADTLSFTDVLVGEVWVASGQSNMAWPVAKAARAEAELAAADHPEIRLFTVERDLGDTPKADVTSTGWRACSPETVADFSAVAYFFGRALHDSLGVPVGLVHSSWGGTPAEAWTGRAALATHPDFQERMDTLRTGVFSSIDTLHRAQAAFEVEEAAWERRVREEDPGFQNGQAIWAAPDVDDGGWAVMDVPARWEAAGLPGFDGAVWFRKEVTVPDVWAGRDLALRLGRLYDRDSTWVNGVLVGHTRQRGRPRAYAVPGDLVRAGRNVIAVRLLNGGEEGGFAGPADAMTLAPQDRAKKETVSLAGPWRYRPTLDFATFPEPPRPPSFQSQPTVLYNAMIAPLTPYAVRGVIWYQGESNRQRAEQYRTLFPALIRDWRAQWDRDDLPFLFVQLAGFQARQQDPVEASPWAELREAQAMALGLPHTGMATAVDIGEAEDIHPRNKQEVGRRLALAALHEAYGRDLVHAGPTFKAMERHGDTLRLFFDGVGGGLEVQGRPLRGFAIAGADGAFVWADVRIEGETVVLSSPDVRDPVDVRYGWADHPAGNLYNREGLPAIPFRTDVEQGEAGAQRVPEVEPYAVSGTDVRASRAYPNSYQDVEAGAAQRRHLIFEDSWEGGCWNSIRHSGSDAGSCPEGVAWKNSQMQGDHAGRVVDVPAREGDHAMRFEWRRAHRGGGNTSKKAHLIGYREDGRTERWYGFSVYFPEDGMGRDSLPEIFAQWHGSPDRDLGEPWRQPPAALAVIDDRLRFSYKSDPDWISTSRGRELPLDNIDLGPVPKDRWVDFVVHARWSPEGEGLVEIWIDGERVVERRGIAIGYNDRQDPYFCIGLYKYRNDSGASPHARRVLYFDAVRIGSEAATPADVAPRDSKPR